MKAATPPEVHCGPGVMYVCRECGFIDDVAHLWCPHCDSGLMVPEAVILHRGQTESGAVRWFVATRG